MKKSILICSLLLVVALASCCPCSLTSNSDLLPDYSSDVEALLPPEYSIYGWIWPSETVPAFPVESKPRFINHWPFPLIKENPQLIIDAGCTLSDNSTDLSCPSTSPLREFDCDYYRKPSGIRGYLDPEFPLVAVCYWQSMYGEYLYRSGCGFVDNISLIFLVDGKYQLINSIEEMQQLMAPITSSKEAAAYAQILTGLDLRHRLPSPCLPYIVYYSDFVEDSYVSKEEDGYLVHMYHSEGCSCDIFITSAVDVFVSHDGALEWRNAEPTYVEVFEGFCLD